MIRSCDCASAGDIGNVLAMFEERFPFGFGAIIEMKTGEEGGIAFRETLLFRVPGDSPPMPPIPILGRLRSRMEEGGAMVEV